jgi:hypothetical protein
MSTGTLARRSLPRTGSAQPSECPLPYSAISEHPRPTFFRPNLAHFPGSTWRTPEPAFFKAIELFPQAVGLPDAIGEKPTRTPTVSRSRISFRSKWRLSNSHDNIRDFGITICHTTICQGALKDSKE